uniref:Global nitrogen transcriptional regulator n=1 Tax=Campylaephora sungminbooi TaxID=1896769 RepID=A0A1B0RRH5_9FLOR|nr:global nitrogen transcriptional regulator [Campylaephora sungminbooi]AKU47374.1 global nitrogen transcriptional regulator [Campylaephora sungminbooi]ALN11821.1 global nitrogen transcriptional regulator [Campylaephora sungminbooi]
MKWISYLFTFNIPFYIYKLKTGDAIIKSNNNFHTQSIVILYGIAYMAQIFSNQEVLPINILHKNNILDIKNYSTSTKSYYKITALQETYLISFSYKNININNNISKIFLKYYLTNYKLTLFNQQMINSILIQKNTQRRIIQLIILLSIQFGIIYQEFVKIPFKIQKRDIAKITGSNVNTTNKTFKILERKKIIHYSKYNLLLIQNYFLIEFIYLLC